MYWTAADLHLVAHVERRALPTSVLLPLGPMRSIAFCSIVCGPLVVLLRRYRVVLLQDFVVLTLACQSLVAIVSQFVNSCQI